jgi:hypothetical protein
MLGDESGGSTMKCLSIEEAAKLGKKDDFFQNVKKAVIPNLIKLGKLNGKTVKGKPCVIEDDTFQQVMQYGIEGFVYNQQGWSFTAVNAPIEKVASLLKGRIGVLKYKEKIKPQKLGSEGAMTPEADKRHIFLVKMRNSEWSILIQTVHWIQSCDMIIGLLLAAELSAALRTTAVAAWDDDFSGSTMVVCENGKKTNVLGDGDDWAEFYQFFYEQGIAVPESFVATTKNSADLLVAKPSEVERADHLLIAIPSESQSNGPHVFYKLGMMAQAISSELEDEEAFQANMVDGLWNQVQAMMKSNKP